MRHGTRGKSVIAAAIVAMLSIGSVARADDVLDRLVKTVIDNYKKNRVAESEEDVASDTQQLFQARLAAKVSTNEVVTAQRLLQTYRLEIDRTDQQIGADASASGSTSAVEKAGLAWLLGLAVENGAITQKEDKTGLTLSTTPYAFFTLGGKDTPDRYATAPYTPLDIARRLGVSATMPLDSGGDAESRNFDPDGVSEITAKFVFYGDRSPRSGWFQQQWLERVQPKIVHRLQGQSLLAKSVFDSPGNLVLVENTYRRIWSQIQKKLEAKPKVAGLDGDIRAIVNKEVDDAVAAAPPLDEAQQKKIAAAAMQFAEANGTIDAEQRELESILKELESTPEVSAAYTYHLQDEDADYSEVKLVADFKTDYVTVVGNAGISFDHGHSDPVMGTSSRDSIPPRRSGVRSYQVSLGLERQIPNFLPFRLEDSGKNDITLSLNGRFERLDDADDELGVAQAKISIPLVPGVDLPISVTYATRSEDVDEEEVRGNFGITVNTDKLYALAGLQAYH